MSNKDAHDLVKQLADEQRDAERQKARDLGIGEKGIGKNTPAAQAQAEEGDLRSSSDLAKFQKAGMKPK